MKRQTAVFFCVFLIVCYFEMFWGERVVLILCYSFFVLTLIPFIVELRHKNRHTDEPELETCFEALYGVLLLRLQKKEVSPATAKAMESISGFISLLASYYNKERNGELDFD